MPIAGSGGLFAIGASVAIVSSTGTQNAHIDTGAQITRAVGGLSVEVDNNRRNTLVALGGSAGFVAAVGSVALALISGDATASIGNVAVGGSGSVGSISVTVDDTVQPLSHAISAGLGAISLAGAFAWTRLSGNAKASSSARGTVGSGGVTIRTTGNRGDDGLRIMADTVNVSVGVLAGGLTIAHAEISRTAQAELDATPQTGATLSTTGAVNVEAEARNHATALSPGGGGGGLSINVMFANAEVSGAITAKINGTVTNSSAITVSAGGDNLAYGKIIVIGVAVAGGNGAFPSGKITDTAGIEATVLSSANLTSSGAVTIEARTRTLGGAATPQVAKAEAFSGALGGITGSLMASEAVVTRLQAGLKGGGAGRAVPPGRCPD